MFAYPLEVERPVRIARFFVVIVCRACDDPPCARACPTSALSPRDGGGVTLLADDCVPCSACRDACPFGAVFWDDEASRPLICVYCGYCAPYCPHDVLEHEEIDRGDRASG